MSVELSIPDDENKTMSSLDVAELTGKQHKNVIRDIEKMLDELQESGGSNLSYQFLSSYEDDRGKTYKCYNLPFKQILNLVSGYDVRLRAKIISKWYDLETKTVELPAPKPKPTLQYPPEMAEEAKSLVETFRAIGMTKKKAGERAIVIISEKYDIKSDQPKVLDRGYKYSPTELGQKIASSDISALSPQKINKLLAAAGLQMPCPLKGWEATSKGKDHSYIDDVAKNNGTGSVDQLKWYESVLPLLRTEYFKKSA